MKIFLQRNDWNAQTEVSDVFFLADKKPNQSFKSSNSVNTRRNNFYVIISLYRKHIKRFAFSWDFDKQNEIVFQLKPSVAWQDKEASVWNKKSLFWKQNDRLAIYLNYNSLNEDERFSCDQRSGFPR